MPRALKKNRKSLEPVASDITLSWRDRRPHVLSSIPVNFLSKTLQFEVKENARAQGQLYKADNLLLMQALMKSHKGKIDLIYIDPPFKTERDFLTSEKAKRGSKKVELAYQDKWHSSGQSFWQFMWERLCLMYELLSPRGSLYLHCDYRTAAPLKLMIDEIFGVDNYVNEIIWAYKTGGNSKTLGFAKKHDIIHFVAKDRERVCWNSQEEKSYLSHNYGFKNIKLHKDEGGIYNYVGMRDVWDIPALRGNQPERVNYPTQKPEALLERIIQASTKPGYLVADFFCGSGTTGVVAKRLKRKWLLSDREALAVKTTKERFKLLD